MASERPTRRRSGDHAAVSAPRENPDHEKLVLRLALFTGLPGVIGTAVLLWRGGYSAKVQWTFDLLVAGSWLIAAFVLRERVVRPLQTLSNMLAALREGDYSIRARGADREDALGLAFLESNLLGETLRTQRLGAMEATALLRTVMAEIDVAVFAFDDANRVRLANKAAESLLAQPAERLLGRTAEQVGLVDMLEGASPRTMDVTFPGGGGRWEVRRGAFRQDGRPHTLLVLADVSKALREDYPCEPINPYGASKWMIERVLADYRAAYGFGSFALRYFNAAGADPAGGIGEQRDVETHLIPRAMMALQGHVPDFAVFGDDYDTPDGTAIRDYIHVTDLAAAHVLALKLLLEGHSGGAFNLGTGNGFSVREILAAIAAETGREVPHVVKPRRSGDPTYLVADPSAARATLNFLPAYSDLATIIRTAWAWHKKAHPLKTHK